MDNEVHARFQRMLLGEPEPQPQPQPKSEPQPEPEAEPHLEQPSQLQSPPPQEQHVDANAHLAPSSPTATASPPRPRPPPPPSTASRHPPTHSPSLVSILQDQWLQLCDYFQRVQCANSTEERATLVRELGVVEDSLNAIVDALLIDRTQLVSTQHLCTHLPIFNESSHSELGAPPSTLSETQEGEARKGASTSGSGPNAHPRDAQMTATMTASTPALLSASAFLVDSALTTLPPCYRFLFADAHHDELASSFVESLEGGGASGHETNHIMRNGATAAPPSAQGNATAHDGKETGKPSDEPSPIGSIFLLTLCQYAKQDEPPGVRSIVLEFLVRLLQEADLPTDRAAYSAGEPALSLLQLNPPLLIVPLLDMLRKVSKVLDPSNTALKHGSVSRSSSLAYPWGSDDEGQDGTFLQDAGRTQFVIFLGSLAEKMELVPALANFFVVEDGAQGERNLFVLLDALLPYLTHDCSAPGWTHRRDTCRYALSAVVSLAKCPDPWIQDLVGKEDRVASRTLMAARTTLLTLCKIPDNDDSATQMLFLRDVLRFWATLSTMSPSVAADLQLATLIEKEFYFQTLIPLLQSSDMHVYAAACLVAAQVFRELNGSAPVLTNSLANVLLATSIRKSSGHIIPHTNHYDSVVTDDTGPGKTTSGATTLGQQEEAAAAHLQMHPTTSFFLYYILPHLSSNPYMSVEERKDSAMLGYATTRWSTAKASLVLIQALAENVPEVFLREVFLMDMNSLTDVLRKQRQSTSPSTSSAASDTHQNHNHDNTHNEKANGVHLENTGLWSTGAAPPHLKVNEYFVKELHETTGIISSLGLQAEQVGEVVLTRLLQTEGNVSIEALRARQEVMNEMIQPNPRSTTSVATVAKDEKTSALPINCWSHAGVQRSALTVAVCEMVQHLDDTPFTVSSLVADVVVSLCLLPDLRVLYTLLDPASGPLKTALCQLRDVLQHRITAQGPHVKVDQTPKKVAATTLGKVSLPLTSSPAQANLSLLILYSALLQHWDSFMGESEVGSNAEHSLSASQHAVGGTPPDQALGAGVPLDALRDAIEANSNVLHACLYFEYLLAHLDAVIGYSALSQNLMYLRTSL